MANISYFRGMAGEVIRNFISIRTILTAFPILVFWGIYLAGMAVIGNRIPATVALLIAILVNLAMIGKFAISSSRGNINVGFFNTAMQHGELFIFLQKVIVLCLIWGLPLSCLVYVTTDFHSKFSLVTLFEMIASIPALLFGALWMMGPKLLLNLILLLMFPFFFIATLAICTRTEDFSDIFSLEPWSWYLGERRSDIIPYLVSILSGYVAFWIIYIIPASLILHYIPIFETGGTQVYYIIMLIPVACFPILVGRLTGAFVLGEGEIDLDDAHNNNVVDIATEAILQANLAQQATAKATQDHTAAAATSSTPKAPLKPPAAAIPPTLAAAAATIKLTPPVPPTVNPAIMAKPKFSDIIEKVNGLTDAEFAPHLNEITSLCKTYPKNPYLAIELSFLLRKANKPDEAVMQASRAITHCFDHLLKNYALDTFNAYLSQKEQIKLGETYFIRLGEALSENKQWFDAAWSFHSILNIPDSDDATVEKKILMLGDKAKKANQLEDSFALFEYFLQSFPNSALREFAQKGLDEVIKLIASQH